MNLPGLGVGRPVLTSMVTLMVVVLGLVSLARLRIDLLPDIERPTASIRTDYEGAAPEVVERRVTQILEEIVSTVPGVVELSSTSEQGESRLTVGFSWGTDIDVAVQDLRARLEDELDELPEDVGRTTIRKFDINSFPVVLLGVSSRLDPVELTEIVENELRDRFARVPGVAQVDPWGGFVREIRVSLDPARLRALGLGLDQVLDALVDANLDLPAGKLEDGRYEVALRAPAEFGDLDTLADTVVATRDGASVTLGQVARVDDTWEALTRVIRVGDAPGVRLAIRKQADANTVEVSEAILAEVARINRDLPMVHVVAVTNQGNFIEQSIDNVARSVVYGGGFAVLVLLFFLRDVRSTAVVSLAIPISVLGTFVLLQQGGFTLNLMTLGGLALGVGMMVDSAIVVLENIFQRRERGDDPMQAAVAGAAEVGPAIVASTLTTLVIFLPILFFQGVTGLLFRELAYVIVLALVVSLLVSLTVVPMLAARLPQPGTVRTERFARLARWAQATVARLEAGYARALDTALAHRGATVGLATALFVASLLLVPLLGTEFLPPSDEGEVRVEGEMELGTRLGLVDQQTARIEAVVREAVPEATASVTTVEGGTTGDAKGEVRLSLGPASSRSRSNTAIAADLRRRLDGQVPGMQIRTRAPQGSFALNRLLGDADEGVTVEVRGDDLDTLAALAGRVAAQMAEVPGVTDVTDSRPEGVPQVQFTVDRAKVASVGLTVRDVARALQVAVAGAQAGEFRRGGDAWRIFVQLDDVAHRTVDDILDMTLTTPDGAQVALRSLLASTPGRGPISIARRDQRRTVTVSANVDGRARGDVAADIDAALATIPRPAGYTFDASGAYEAQQEAFGELRTSLLLSLLLVYMVLAGQYESLKDPLVVMLSVPFAAVGVLVTLFVTGTTLNLQSGIGTIMLGGIVVNNAILLVDLAGRLQAEEGMRAHDAAALAGRRRLRPILMTTLTTLLGLVPLALGLGEGADAQAPLARAVVGGLFASTVLSLVLIPVLYTWAHPDRRATPSA
ncbi:MAG: efflux RND transporter permease subunit [Alphaproteobacteria bacterium]|nr:efflux RND transporter permease subunit [Alphaproteobacteria bacterium]